jgi:DNA-directed RNA polymerase specialized sigma24 family protein
MAGMPETSNATERLLAWARGQDDALERLAPLVEGELHRLAQGYMRRERPNHTLQATALVNEVYLRLIEIKRVDWQNRAHFIAMAARLISADVMTLEEALQRLERMDPRRSQVVALRFFGGLSIEETAVALGVSIDTVKRDWRVAKLWIRRELGSQ